MGAAASGLLGGAGLLEGAAGQNAQKGYEKQAIAALQPQLTAQKTLLKDAQAYDPAMQDKQAFASANQQASGQLGQTLGNLSGQFQSAGGSPTGDTAFGGIANNAANRIQDPLRVWMANQQSTEAQRKMQAFDSVFQAPAGNIASNYFKAAQLNTPSYGPSLQLLSQAFKGLGPKASGSGFGSDPGMGTGPGDPLSVGGGDPGIGGEVYT